MDPVPYGTEREYTIEPGCPWYEAQQSFGPPNVNWCEPTVCSWINEPANTWSNLGFALVFVILVSRFKDQLVRNFAWCVLFMGFVSATYHATNNYLTQYIDFLGMFLVTSYILAFNSLRVRKKPLAGQLTWLWFYFMVHSVLFMIFDIVNWPIQPLVAMGTFPIIVLDLYCGFREKILGKYLYFLLGMIFLVVAQGFAIMDIKRVYCNPENLFLHGHVLWHLLSATSMLFYGIHIKRISGWWK